MAPDPTLQSILEKNLLRTRGPDSPSHGWLECPDLDHSQCIERDEMQMDILFDIYKFRMAKKKIANRSRTKRYWQGKFNSIAEELAKTLSPEAEQAEAELAWDDIDASPHTKPDLKLAADRLKTASWNALVDRMDYEPERHFGPSMHGIRCSYHARAQYVVNGFMKSMKGEDVTRLLEVIFS